MIAGELGGVDGLHHHRRGRERPWRSFELMARMVGCDMVPVFLSSNPRDAAGRVRVCCASE